MLSAKNPRGNNENGCVMQDERLLNLVRMSLEADELERSAAAPFRATSSPRLATRAALGWVGSIAAALLIVAGAWWLNRPSPNPAPPLGLGRLYHNVPALSEGPRPVWAGLNTERQTQASTSSDAALDHEHESCNTQSPVLLAVFQHADGRCDCVVWKPGAFTKDFDRIERADLVHAAWQYRCAETSDLVLVAAVDGPRDLLPLDPGVALELATRLALERERCGEDAACYEHEALQFLSPSVSIRAETVALASR
jgi:hypothetical protein